MKSFCELNNIINLELQKKPKVVAIILDAFGWNLFNKLQLQSKFIKKYYKLSEPLKSVFPSATAAAMGAFSFNCTPAQHGVLDAKQFIPELDQYIWTFNRKNFITGKDLTENEAKNIFTKHITYWHELSDRGIDSTVIMHKNLLKSDYNREILRGASQTVPFVNFDEGLTLLAKNLAQRNGVFCFYWDDIDLVSHEYGWNSEEVQAVALAALSSLNTFLQGADMATTSVYIFSDHGQTVVTQENQLVLDQLIPGFFDYLPESQDGNIVLPSGSSREVFLMVKPERKEELLKKLQDVLRDKADVYNIDSAFVEKWFGLTPLNFIERLGNIAILPKDGYGVWYSWNGKSKVRPGAHGGISRDEREAILISII